MDLAAEEPFKARELQIMETSYIDQAALEAAETCIFKGEFMDQEKQKVGMVILPESFFDLHHAELNMNVFRQVGLDGYFGLEPWGVDLQRAYELMTSINSDGVATLTGKDGEQVQVHISEELISEALHLPKPRHAVKIPYHLTDQERKDTFLIIKGKKETFSDLIKKELDLPLRLYSQHFVMGKPQKYTQPCKRVAGLMTRAVTKGQIMPGDFSYQLKTDLIAHKESKGLKEKPYLANGQLLTRVAYQALGMMDELPKAVSQEQASHELGPIKVKPVSMIIPPRERSKRTLYKGGRPVRAESQTTGVEQMAEEPSITPLSETYRRRAAEKVYEAIRKVKDLGQGQAGKGKEKMIDPERRTKHKQDPRERAAREEREEATQAQTGLEALGRETSKENPEDIEESRGTKRKHEEFAQSLQDTAEEIEQLAKILKTGAATEEESGSLTEEARKFVEDVLQTPSSHEEPKNDTKEDEEVMQDMPEQEIFEDEPTQKNMAKGQDEDVQNIVLEIMMELVEGTLERYLDEESPEKEDKTMDKGEGDKEPERPVLRRKVKQTPGSLEQGPEPAITLTKKVVQETEQKEKEKDIDTERPTTREMETVTKPHVEQHEAGTSSRMTRHTPERVLVDDESEEEQDEVMYHLDQMLKSMEKAGRANEKKNAQYESLMAVSLEQQNIQKEQQKYMEDLSMKVAIIQSLYEAEGQRTSELSERLNQALQRAVKAETELKENKEELALQKLQNEQMKLALQSANQRRTAAEDELDRLLSNPILSTTRPSTSDEAQKKEHLELTNLLQDKERQLGVVTTMFFQKEQELQTQMKGLQTKLEEAQKEMVLKEQLLIEPAPVEEHRVEKEFTFDPTDTQYTEEAGSSELQTPDELAQMTQAEIELAALISDSLEPIQKQCMEWEKRVLHSAAICFPKAGDLNKAYHRPTLPFPLLKHEYLKTKEALTPLCTDEEIGGYHPISLEQWQSKQNMQNQPTWRLGWFRKYPNSKTAYARAPREMRVDPTFCPVRRRRTWEEYKQKQRVQPTWLNYPLLPAPPADQEPTEAYMLETLNQAIQQFKGVPDLACQMLIKVCKMILACIEDFHDAIHMRATWTRFLEGRQGLSWNLQLAPDPHKIMGLFARLHFIAGHYLQTFEDAFYTGFFEYQSHIFGPLVHDLGARLIAYQAMERKFPLRDMIEDARRERDYQRHLKALDYINKDKVQYH